MSGIYAIFQPDTGPVNPDSILAMHQVFAHWYDDDRGSFCEVNVGLGHTMRWNTPESKLESLPYVDGPVGERLGITADVRLDNRAELARLLNITEPLSDVTDSRLLLAAYRKWGEGLPEHLLGDFAFVLWDEARNQLFCARDHLGTKSLYYFSDGVRWVFANHVHAVVAVPGVSNCISEEAVCRYLKEGELCSPTLTFYKGVKKLPAATSFLITGGQLRNREYWSVDQCPPVRLESPKAYVDRLRELLEAAVACRLRSDYPVAAHLSGGLDSSSIVAIAARKLGPLGNVLHTYNWCPDPTGASEEATREWIRGTVLAESEGLKHNHVDLTAERLAAILMEHDLTGGDTVDLWYEFIVRNVASTAGQRTILSGWGGDQGISNSGTGVLAELFWSGSPLEALRIALDAAKLDPKPWCSFLELIFKKIAFPVVPDFVRRMLGRGPAEQSDFAGLAAVSMRSMVTACAPAGNWQKKRSVREKQLQHFHGGYLQNRLESWAASAHEAGVEYRYPLLDKRLVEFALGIPPECYWQHGYGRHIFRKATDFYLPQSICWGEAKDEVERVKLLQEVERQAFALLMERGLFSGTQSGIGNSFIDLAAVRSAISRYCKSRGDPMEPENMSLCETLEKSILVLRL